MARFIKRQIVPNLLRESLRNVLNEALSRTVYHFTDVESAYRILFGNVMFCQSSYAGYMADDSSDKYKFYICFARNKNAFEGFATTRNKYGARIEFDGELLSQNFKGGAYNYWGGGEVENKYTYMRSASGMEDWYSYHSTKDTPEPSQVVDMGNRMPYATKTSPLYIKVGSTIFKKKHHNETSAPAQDDGYVLTDKPVGLDNVPEVKKDSYDFKYPDSYSPEYVTADGKFYKKEKVTPSNIRKHPEFEMEDRLLTNKPAIDGILKYIRRVDIIVTSFDKLNNEEKRFLYALSRSNICFIYDNIDDFNRQTQNTVNKKISGMREYSGVILRDRKASTKDIAIIIKFFSTAFGVEPNDIGKFTSSALKKYGLGKYTREVLKKIYTHYGHSVSLLADIVKKMSKSPSTESQSVLSMVHGFFKKGGWKNWRDVQAAINNVSYPKSKYDNIDCRIKLERRVLFIDRLYKIDITDPSIVDFWCVFNLNTLKERYNFIDNLISDLQYEHGDEWALNVLGGDTVRFKKYLQNLAHKEVSWNDMLSIMEKIGVNLQEIRSAAYIDQISIENMELDYFDYTSTINKVPYYTKDDDYKAVDEYATKIFSKK